MTSEPKMQPGSVDRLYILNGGEALVSDLSQWSPGVNVDKPGRFSSNAYVIQHGSDWMIWDTGFDDDLDATPEGVEGQHGVRGVVTRTIAAQLAEIGLALGDITLFAISHAHFDHVGNSRLFPHATLLMQRAEWNAMFGPDPGAYGFVPHLYRTMRHNPVLLLNGDHEVFRDDSVRILSTPGHTPGHQSLLVRLPESGSVILSGDVAHFVDNYTHRRVPKFNADAQQTKASMERIDQLVRSEGATLWINHDLDQSAKLSPAPMFIR